MSEHPSWEERQHKKAAASAKRVATMSQEGKPFTVDTPDGPVTLTKQPMEWFYPFGWSYNYRSAGDRTEADKEAPEGPKFKAKYKVEFAGVHRGWIICDSGWGKPWELKQLRDDKNINWASDGCGSMVEKKSAKGGGRDALAMMVPEMVRQGMLDTLEEMAAKRAAAKKARAEREAVEAERTRVNRQERLAEAWKVWTEAGERAEVLRELMARGVLTNLEAAVVDEAARHFEDIQVRTAGEIAGLKAKLGITD